MTEHDYSFKVVLIGDDTVGKTYFAANFCDTSPHVNYIKTIGLDIHGKTLNALGKTVKILLWELSNDEKFRTHESYYLNSASGAIIISEVRNADFQYDLDYTIQAIEEHVGDIPIIMLTFNHDTKEFQAILGVNEIVVTNSIVDLAFSECSARLIKNPELIFTKLVEHIIKWFETSPPPKLSRRGRIKPEFVINKYLKLQLESGRTNVYVGKELFKQCKFLLLDIPVDKVSDYDEIESIDEAAEKLDRSLETGRSRKYHISPDIEFWGHCSNLQVWYENKYDTRILHSNLAFPLLHALVKAGDPLAKKVFNEEIALRLSSGYPSVVQYLINENYLKYLKKEELDSLLEDNTFIRNLPKWFSDFKDIPKLLLRRIMTNLKHKKCPYCDSKISTSSIKKFLMGTPIKCELCHKNIFIDDDKDKYKEENIGYYI